MSLSPLVRRLERVERMEAKGSRATTQPYTRIITESDEDRDQQLAALEQAGLHTPGSLVIDRRIVNPALKKV